MGRLLILWLAWIVPGDARSEWRREWLAELEAGGALGRSPARFLLGAPAHALSLRAVHWHPGVVAADARFALRLLRRRPGFTFVSVLTLAAGVGACTAIFSVVYGVLLKPLPYGDPDRLVELWETNPLFNWTEAEVAPGNVISWRDRNVTLGGIAWYLAGADRHGGLADLTLGGTNPERVTALQVSSNFFETLGVGASLGRVFAPGEDIPGRHRVVVLSNRFWRSRLGGRPDVVGSTIPLNGRDWQVVGVMAESFAFDNERTDMWIPLAADEKNLRDARQPHIFRAIARLKKGVTVAQARDNLVAIAAELEREYPKTNRQMSVGVGPLNQWLTGKNRAPLLLFWAGAAVVLLIACANVANLMIARAAGRAREFGVRVALGASRLRIIRQVLIESLTIASMGAAGGIAIAAVALRVFIANAPASLPRVGAIGLHPQVLLFVLTLVVLTTMLVGTFPAARAARPSVSSHLGDGGRTVSTRGRVNRVIVGFEVTLTVMLLVVGAAMVRSFRALVGVDLGFPVQGLVTAQISPPAVRYPNAGQTAAFFDDLAAKLRASPGILNAGATSGLPVDGGSWSGDLFVESRPDVHARDLRHKSVTPGYLETLGLRLTAGRDIAATDRPDQPPVVVINSTLARRYFGGADPIGRRIAFDAPSPSVKWRTIVGVVSDEPQRGVHGDVSSLVYDSEAQQEMRTMTIAVRSALPTDEVVRVLHASVHTIDPSLAMVDAEPFADRMSRILAPERLMVALTSIFGTIGLLLAATGVYGVVSYAVTVRTREVGVRMACGATPRAIVRLLVTQHLRMVGAGIAVGAPAALFVLGLFAATLYGVPRYDLASLGTGAALLLAVTTAACVIPARRTLRIDPVRALRED